MLYVFVTLKKKQIDPISDAIVPIKSPFLNLSIYIIKYKLFYGHSDLGGKLSGRGSPSYLVSYAFLNS